MKSWENNTTKGKQYIFNNWPQKIEIHKLSNKEFKIIVQKKLRELQENTDKQFNKIRKAISEQIRSSTERQKT